MKSNCPAKAKSRCEGDLRDPARRLSALVGSKCHYRGTNYARVPARDSRAGVASPGEVATRGTCSSATCAGVPS
jgi:hypothetical protein